MGIADLVAQLNGLKTVVDFKTANSDYEDHEVVLSDQLTAYWLADPEAQKVALCVLVKTKEPKIEWHFAERDAERLTEYLAKVQIIFADIHAGKFYKRPGKHCSYCDFLPVCPGDKKKAQETLVRITCPVFIRRAKQDRLAHFLPSEYSAQTHWIDHSTPHTLRYENFSLRLFRHDDDRAGGPARGERTAILAAMETEAAG